MRSPRVHKVLADMKVSRSRTILVILSIAIGIFAVGTMLTTRIILQHGVDSSFDLANPASAVLMTEPFDAGIVAAARALPGVGDAEGRATVAVRLQVADGAWRNLNLVAIPDFGDIRIDLVLPESGAWPPAPGEVLIERASLNDADAATGGQLVIETPGGARHTLGVGGVAYDPGQVAPMLAEDRLSGYITLETLAILGEPAQLNQLHIVAADDPRDLDQGELVAGLARDQVLEPNGIAVHRIAVHDTPRYHSAVLIDALLLILGLLGGLVLLLGVLLVINTVSALLAQQVRQIGMMKAIGGRKGQIVVLYLGLVLAYGGLAVLVAVPLAALAAWRFTRLFSDVLNIDVTGPWFPPVVVALEVALGLLVPVLAALVPVLRGARITVREAVTSYGLSQQSHAGGIVDRVTGHLHVPRPVMLALGNTFRRRGRLTLTLATLTLGGALFASVATVQSSLEATLEEVMRYSDYDAQLSLDDPEPVSGAIAAVQTIPGVEHAEGWIATNASRVRPDGTQNSNIWFMAAPAASGLIQPTLVEGRWLEPGEEALVVNVDFRDAESDIGVGDGVVLWVEGQRIQWPVVGVVSSQLMGPVVFAPLEPLGQALGMAGEANRIMLVTSDHRAAAQLAAATLAEQALRADGLPVVQVDTQSDMRTGTQSAFNLAVILLYVVGGLLVVVGSLGLMGAMSLNVLERTREIGVMRAIGASNGVVARLVIVEGLVVGLLSWLISGLLALPLSWALSSVIGIAFVQSPLAYTFSMLGLLLWLVIVVVLSVLSSLLPARRAWRLSVREVLAYE